LQDLLARGFFFTFAFQLSLYYFELYDLKVIQHVSKLAPRLAQSVAATLAGLTITYYMLPFLYLGRGVLLITISLATTAAFFWRIIYRFMVKGVPLNERIIILGTGELAREIAKEIRDKRDSGFEIIGHIDEKKAEGDS